MAYVAAAALVIGLLAYAAFGGAEDRKSTRLNSSHLVISYAVFCLKKKNSTSDSACYASSCRFNVDVTPCSRHSCGPANPNRKVSPSAFGCSANDVAPVCLFAALVV